MVNFNEICRKNITSDNMKCHQTSGLHLFPTKKPRVGQVEPLNRFRVKSNMII